MRLTSRFTVFFRLCKAATLVSLTAAATLLWGCAPSGGKVSPPPPAAGAETATAAPPAVTPTPAPAPALAGEIRAVWLDKGEYLKGRPALEALLDRLKEAGFNTIYAQTHLRGYVVYPESEILPQWPELRDRDPELLAWLVGAAHARGLKIQAWPEYGFYAYWTRDATADPSHGPLLDAHPELAARRADGGDFIHNSAWGDYYALCPANPRSQDIMLSLYMEMMERFVFDGLNLDRVRFPDARYCHCDFCRERFQADTGLELAEFAPGSPGAAAFDAWRRRQTLAFVCRVAEQMRDRFPGRALTAAVVPPEMIPEKGQDWPGWSREGCLDLAVPMLYMPEISSAAAWIEERLGAPPAALAGLDASRGADVLARQIREARARRWPGFAIWQAGTLEPLLPQLRETLAPATAP